MGDNGYVVPGVVGGDVGGHGYVVPAGGGVGGAFGVAWETLAGTGEFGSVVVGTYLRVTECAFLFVRSLSSSCFLRVAFLSVHPRCY